MSADVAGLLWLKFFSHDEWGSHELRCVGRDWWFPALGFLRWLVLLSNPERRTLGTSLLVPTSAFYQCTGWPLQPCTRD